MGIFRSKERKLEKKFSKLNQTTNRKEALDYIVHTKEGLLSELKEKLDSQLIKDFEIMGYLIVQGNNYKYPR